jgi:hypothetical protein
MVVHRAGDMAALALCGFGQTPALEAFGIRALRLAVAQATHKPTLHRA